MPAIVPTPLLCVKPSAQDLRFRFKGPLGYKDFLINRSKGSLDDVTDGV